MRTRSRSFRALLQDGDFWAILLLAFVGSGLLLDWSWLRGNEQFRWQRYELPGIETRVWATAAVLLGVGLVGYRLMTRPTDSTRRRWLVVVLTLFLLGLLVRVAFQFLEHPDPLVTLFYRTVSTRNLGAFYFDAVNIQDMSAFLRSFPSQLVEMVGFSPRTHPPGNLIVFWGAARLFERLPGLANGIGAHFRDYLCAAPESPILYYPNHLLAAATLQVAMPLWGALAVVPFLILARRLADVQSAIRGGVFLILTPGIVLFLGHWAHAYTLLAMWALLLTHLGLEKRNPVFLLLAGFFLSMATFMSFSNTAVGAMVFCYLLLYHAQYLSVRERQTATRQELYRLLINVMALSVGTASLWIAYQYFFGVGFLDVYRQGMSMHEQITGYRSYGLWLFYNLIDFWLFMGIPAVVAVVSMFGREISSAGLPFINRRAYIPFWTFVLVLLALNLSGVSRGEVARLWMFFMPLAWMAVLPVLAHWSRRRVGVMLAVQLTQLLLLGYFVRTIGPSNYPFYTSRPIAHTLPAESVPVQAVFGDDPIIRLLAYSIDRPMVAQDETAENTVDVTLYWQATGRISHPYTVFVHMLDPSGQLVAQHDGMPQQDVWPTICWRPGEIVADTHQLKVPAGMNMDSTNLYTGLYRLDLLTQGDPNVRLSARWNGGQGDAFPLQQD